jgi:hypothetical protein
MKQYPRLVVYKQAGRCEHERVDQPWRVRRIDSPGFAGPVEFMSVSVESCWEHVAYKLNPKLPRQRLTLTLNKNKH